MLGIGVGLLWLAHRLRQRGWPVEPTVATVLGLVLAGLVGARLTYFLFFPTLFWANPVQAMLANGGLVWYGGVATVLGLLVVVRSWLPMPALSLLDALAPPAGVGLALGRLGCLLAGCCYGGPCPTEWAWAVHYPLTHPMGGVAVHPVPLYESAGALLLSAGLLEWERRASKPTTSKPTKGTNAKHFGPAVQPGQVAGAFLLGYSLLRFGLEYWRADRLVWLESLDLSASQVISLAAAVLGAVLLLRRGHPLATPQ